VQSTQGEGHAEHPVHAQEHLVAQTDDRREREHDHQQDDCGDAGEGAQSGIGAQDRADRDAGAGQAHDHEPGMGEQQTCDRDAQPAVERVHAVQPAEQPLDRWDPGAEHEARGEGDIAVQTGLQRCAAQSRLAEIGDRAQQQDGQARQEHGEPRRGRRRGGPGVRGCGIGVGHAGSVGPSGHCGVALRHMTADVGRPAFRRYACRR